MVSMVSTVSIQVQVCVEVGKTTWTQEVSQEFTIYNLNIRISSCCFFYIYSKVLVHNQSKRLLKNSVAPDHLKPADQEPLCFHKRV